MENPIVQNLDVAKSTTRQELSTEEHSLSKALSDKKVKDLSENEFKAMMLFVYTLIGLRGENYPKGLDKDFIHSYIRDGYGNHSCSEVRLAFTMAIQRKLSLTEEEVTTFEFFTASYFSRILNAYRSWSREAVKHLPQKFPELATPVVSDEEFINSVLSLYRVNKNWKLIPELAYQILEPTMNLSLADKVDIRLKVNDLLGKDSKELCRQFAVKLYFDKLIQDERKTENSDPGL